MADETTKSSTSYVEALKQYIVRKFGPSPEKDDTTLSSAQEQKVDRQGNPIPR